MTTKKKFKDRIRERMAATGESYTAAKAALDRSVGYAPAPRDVRNDAGHVFRAEPFETPVYKPEGR